LHATEFEDRNAGRSPVHSQPTARTGVGPVYGYAGDGSNSVIGALEFVVDPQLPPLPPHVKVGQMKKTATAMLHGGEDAIGIARKGVTGKLAEVKEHLPGAGH